jgi:hypothetical protein
LSNWTINRKAKAIHDSSKAEASKTIGDEAMELWERDLSRQAIEKVHVIIPLARHQHEVKATDERPPVDEQDDYLRAMMDSDDPDIWPRLI